MIRRLATLGLAASLFLMVLAPASLASRHNLLSDIPVTGSLEDGSTFEGVLSLTELSLDDGILAASGTLTGTVTDALGNVTEITQTFTDVTASLLNPDGGRCDILFLDLGPIFLDLLGLEVDLSQIVLDVDAVPGPGNLLGNLLCAVAGLLDGGPTSGLSALLGRINNLLGGLLG